jgi:hypothetical protein
MIYLMSGINIYKQKIFT